MVHEDNPKVLSLCFTPNGNLLLAWTDDNCARLWDPKWGPNQGIVKKTYQGHANSRFAITGCFGSTDDPAAENVDPETGELEQLAFIASASEDGDIVMWDVRSKEVVQRIDKAHDGVCFGVHVVEDCMVSAGQDHIVHVWRNKASRKRIRRADSRADSTMLPDDVMSGTNGVNGVHSGANGHAGDSENFLPGPGSKSPTEYVTGDVEMEV
jgi:COMPASS component SWD3